MTKDQHPSAYGDLMVEATRLVPVGADDVVFGFQVWDMDDFDVESTILFRTTKFEAVERLGSIDDLVFDLWSSDTELLALCRTTVHCYTTSELGKPSASMSLPITTAKAIVGPSSKCLHVAGDGIATFDGHEWKKLAVRIAGEPADVENLRAVAVSRDHVYAVGKRGCVVELSPQGVRRIHTPASAELTGVHVDSAGILSIAGHRGTVLQGPVNDLVALAAPDGVSHMNHVCEFQGKLYWSAVGNVGGVFVQQGKQLVPSLAEACWHLTPTDRYLYAAGERAVFRFDGETWLALGIDYDEEVEQWVMTPLDHDGGA